MITAEVGVIRFTNPDADWYAVTATERATPAKSASGPRIGITSAACPDDEGTRKAIGTLTINVITPNTPAEAPETAASIQCRTVSVMYVFFITAVIPRASTMISAAPRKSEAPAMMVLTVPSSPSLAITPMTTAITKNSAAASGK